ncbi:MAG: FkbM family methyltransferase [Alphaproteobacteria bacterium]
MPTHALDKPIAPPFGSFKPKLGGRAILALVRLGLGRGGISKRLRTIWCKWIPMTIVDVVYHGLKLRLQPEGNFIESKILFSSGLREAKALSWLQNMLPPLGGIFIDIGANIGYYALMGAKFGAAKVLAVEPNPELAQRLREAIETNGFGQQISVFEVGLGPREETLRFVISKEDKGSSSAVKQNLTGEAIQIQVIPLRKLLASQGVKTIDVLKIDVEGMEDTILFDFFENASPQLFPRLIIMEENQSLWQRDILAWLLTHGYILAEKLKDNVILIRN